MSNQSALMLVYLSLLLACSVIGDTIIPFDASRGIVEVDVLLNQNIKGRFGIDTGADQLYIDRRFAERNGLPFAENTRQRQSVGLHGASAIAYVDLGALKFGDEILTAPRATVIDLIDLSVDKSAPPPDGLIGYEILRNYYLTIDYPARELSLQSEKPSFLNGREYSEFAFRKRQHLIILEVQLNGRLACPMILDYCASHTSISPQFATELDFNSTAGSVHMVDEVSLTGAVVGRNVELDKIPVIVTDLTSYQRSMSHSDIAGILGANLLFRLKITIDYSGKRILVHR